MCVRERQRMRIDNSKLLSCFWGFGSSASIACRNIGPPSPDRRPCRHPKGKVATGTRHRETVHPGARDGSCRKDRLTLNPQSVLLYTLITTLLYGLHTHTYAHVYNIYIYIFLYTYIYTYIYIYMCTYLYI